MSPKVNLNDKALGDFVAAREFDKKFDATFVTEFCKNGFHYLCPEFVQAYRCKCGECDHPRGKKS